MPDTPIAGEAGGAGPGVAGSRRKVRARYVVAALVCAGAIAWMLVGGLAKNLVYLKPVSEAVAERPELGTKRFRMGGTVVPGSVSETGSGVRFAVVEGGTTAEVDHSGDPPDLFEECAPVVVEGRWDGAVFRSDRLLIKHGEEYSPESEALDECLAEPEGVRGSQGSAEGSTAP